MSSPHLYSFSWESTSPLLVFDPCLFSLLATVTPVFKALFDDVPELLVLFVTTKLTLVSYSFSSLLPVLFFLDVTSTPRRSLFMGSTELYFPFPKTFPESKSIYLKCWYARLFFQWLKSSFCCCLVWIHCVRVHWNLALILILFHFWTCLDDGGDTFEPEKIGGDISVGIVFGVGPCWVLSWVHVIMIVSRCKWKMHNN